MTERISGGNNYKVNSSSLKETLNIDLNKSDKKTRKVAGSIFIFFTAGAFSSKKSNKKLSEARQKQIDLSINRSTELFQKVMNSDVIGGAAEFKHELEEKVTSDAKGLARSDDRFDLLYEIADEELNFSEEELEAFELLYKDSGLLDVSEYISGKLDSIVVQAQELKDNAFNKVDDITIDDLIALVKKQKKFSNLLTDIHIIRKKIEERKDKIHKLEIKLKQGPGQVGQQEELQAKIAVLKKKVMNGLEELNNEIKKITSVTVEVDWQTTLTFELIAPKLEKQGVIRTPELAMCLVRERKTKGAFKDYSLSAPVATCEGEAKLKIKLRGLSEKQRKQRLALIAKELKIQTSLQDLGVPNIVGIIRSRKTAGSQVFHAENFDKDLDKAIRYMSDEQREKSLSVVVSALFDCFEGMHDKGYIHYDIKPGNILVDVDDNNIVTKVGITDFGLTKKGLPDDFVYSSKSLPKDPGKRVIFGTRPFMAPELLGEGAVGGYSDAWALAQTVFVFRYCDTLFHLERGENESEYNPKMSHICQNAKKLKDAYSQEDYKENMEALYLKKKKELLEGEQTMDAVDRVLIKLFYFSPTHRISIKQAKKELQAIPGFWPPEKK